MIESYYRCRGVQCPLAQGCARHTSPPPVFNDRRGPYMTGFWRTRATDNNACFIPDAKAGETLQLEMAI